ncbi:unnamed protein product [Oikopleura dioica]|uniref:Uncharacterized protein n=1 Tax=Oikopleura dioica TaxID=34765 RepID=E4Y905_OIKDI|nr:unnamed protein product [Oikopleura dioica]
MRRASNFFKSYHLYENRLATQDKKNLAKKTLHHMKLKEFSEIDADLFEVPFKPSGTFGLNVGSPKISPNENWNVHDFICENGWAKSQGDHVCYISGRKIETFLSEEPFALVYLGPNFERFLRLPSSEEEEQNAKYATLYAFDLALKVAISQKWITIQLRTDNLAVANLFNYSLPKITENEINDFVKSNNRKSKYEILLETILKQRANIAFNVTYIDPTIRVSKLKRRTVDEGIVKLNRLAEAAQRDLIEKENLFFAEK